MEIEQKIRLKVILEQLQEIKNKLPRTNPKYDDFCISFRTLEDIYYG